MKIRGLLFSFFIILLVVSLYFVYSAEAAGKRRGPKATLTLIKTVVNDNGGTKQAGGFTLQIDGQTVQSGVPRILTMGAHIASEIPMVGYSSSGWGGDCASDGSITLQRKQNAICTITNDDIGHSILQDDFNAYTDGSIVGQGSWNSYLNGGNFRVQGITVFEGAGALYNNSFGDAVVGKQGAPLADGRQSVYVRTENRANWGFYNNDGNVGVRISKGLNASDAAGLSFVSIGFTSDGRVTYYDQMPPYTLFCSSKEMEFSFGSRG